MTMAFLVASIFGSLAFISNLYINFIEQKSNLLVFFEVGVEPEILEELKTEWEGIDEIKSISFTSEEQAYELYSDYTARISDWLGAAMIVVALVLVRLKPRGAPALHEPAAAPN